MEASQIIRNGPAPTGNEPSIAERYNRLRKAIKIADYLQASGISSSMTQLATPPDYELAARATGYESISTETWHVVTELLVGREQAVDALRRKQDKAVAR